MVRSLDTALHEHAWLTRWKGDRFPASTEDWEAVVRAFPTLSVSADQSPACALVDCLYDDPSHKPGTVAGGKLRKLDAERAVSGVVYWIFCELASSCASDALHKAECTLGGLSKLVKRTGGTLSGELTRLIRVGLAELAHEVSHDRLHN